MSCRTRSGKSNCGNAVFGFMSDGERASKNWRVFSCDFCAVFVGRPIRSVVASVCLLHLLMYMVTSHVDATCDGMLGTRRNDEYDVAGFSLFDIVCVLPLRVFSKRIVCSVV